MHWRAFCGLVLLALAVPPIPGAAQNGAQSGTSAMAGEGNSTSQAGQEAARAADLDLEQLANVEVSVTSASKKSESLFEAAAAIYVLTQEDIRRGGFSTLPEALRMVPGLYVAQASSHVWQISARGFSDRNNNKMLVLVDGRSAYTPELGSVYWDVLDIPLENVERIEVIRGPGGTLWGANAVNGVVNIITKAADQVQGAMVSASVGTEDSDYATVRYGGQISAGLAYYVYGRAYYGEPLQSPSGMSNPDYFTWPQAGARLDWTVSSQDTVSLEASGADGRFITTRLGSSAPTSALLKDNNVLLRWKHAISDRSSTDTMAYCNWHARFGAPGEMRNSCDLEFQHNYQFTDRHSLIWGGSFFTTGDDLTPDAAPYIPEQRRDYVVSGFAQYEIALLPGRLRLLGGSKFEHNGYTGFEYQPQVRGVWTPGKSHAVWASMSRAVRIPTRNNSDLNLVIPVGESGGTPVFEDISGDPSLTSERLRAYEVGYRYQRNQTLSVDTAVYYNDYHDLITTAEPVTEVLPDRIILHTPFINGPVAQTHGAELSAKWRPVSRWAITCGITELRGSTIALLGSPQHIFNVQSHADLPHSTEFDFAVYRSGAVLLSGASNSLPSSQRVPSFSRIDVGAAWHLNQQWTLAVWGRNLQTPRHRETDTTFGDPVAYVPRSVAFKLLWRSQSERRPSQ